MLVRIEKNVNSSYRNVMQKVVYIETEHVESLLLPDEVRMVSGATHKVSREHFDLVLDVIKNTSKNKSQQKV